MILWHQHKVDANQGAVVVSLRTGQNYQHSCDVIDVASFQFFDVLLHALQVVRFSLNVLPFADELFLIIVIVHQREIQLLFCMLSVESLTALSAHIHQLGLNN